MKRIKLISKEWSYDPNKPLGPKGGFGEVFLGKDSDNNPVAVKKIKIEAEEASHREFDIAVELSGKKYRHIIPILDSGQDSESGSYFLVMSKADRSLQEYIDEVKSVDDKTACKILLEIRDGLDEVPKIVHRDLKPANVLYYKNNWSISDFGIARFVEKATSLRTLRESLTPPYASPEQWELKKSSNATDIYALGCIGYFLLTGAPPFEGPHKEEFQDQHLKQKPPQLEGHNNRLQSLLHMMLRKSPSSRPSRIRIKEILISIIEKDGNEKTSNGSGLDALSRAGVQVAQREAEFESMEIKKELESKNREETANASYEILNELIKNLFEKMLSATPNAVQNGKHRISLGDAYLEFKLFEHGKLIFKETFKEAGWDVVASARITVVQKFPHYPWSASLWYMKRNLNDNYRWHEISYMNSPFSRNPTKFVPFAAKSILDAVNAARPGMDVIQHAWGPRIIDDENSEEFCERWAKLLSRAAQGILQHPQRLPLSENDFK